MWNNDKSIPIFCLTLIMSIAFCELNSLFAENDAIEERLTKLEIRVDKLCAGKC
jgi:hypothetical protein